MFCAFTRPKYQVSVYRTIGHLVLLWHSLSLQNNYFGVRVSVTFHLMCVHIISSPEPAAHR